jgi:hypothetical protein
LQDQEVKGDGENNNIRRRNGGGGFYGYEPYGGVLCLGFMVMNCMVVYCAWVLWL